MKCEYVAMKTYLVNDLTGTYRVLALTSRTLRTIVDTIGTARRLQAAPLQLCLSSSCFGWLGISSLVNQHLISSLGDRLSISIVRPSFLVKLKLTAKIYSQVGSEFN